MRRPKTVLAQVAATAAILLLNLSEGGKYKFKNHAERRKWRRYDRYVTSHQTLQVASIIPFQHASWTPRQMEVCDHLHIISNARVKVTPSTSYFSDVLPHGGCLGRHEPRGVLDGLLQDVCPHVDPHRFVGNQRGKSGLLLLTARRQL